MSRLHESELEQRLTRVRNLAALLDDRFSIPGTRIRFGMDSLVGLVPGIGDAAGAVAGVWLVVEARRLGASRFVLLRMCTNLLIDSTIGAIPVAGDLFDLLWKSNRRNLTLLETHLNQRQSNR